MKIFIVLLLSTSYVFAEDTVVGSAPAKQVSASPAPAAPVVAAPPVEAKAPVVEVTADAPATVVAPETPTTTSAPESTETPAVAETPEEVEAPEVPELSRIECEDVFLEYLKKQPKAVQEKNMKTYFSLSYSTGREFINIMKNEFEWKAKESEYKNKYKELLNETKNYALFANVKFGKYDFKKEHFPIEFELREKDVLDTYGIGLSCNSMNLDQQDFNNATIKITNLKKQYFFKVDPKTAEKITSFLSGDRNHNVEITFIPKVATGKLVNNYLFKGKFKFALEIKGEISELFFKFHEAPELGKIYLNLK